MLSSTCGLRLHFLTFGVSLQRALDMWVATSVSGMDIHVLAMAFSLSLSGYLQLSKRNWPRSAVAGLGSRMVFRFCSGT